MQSCWAQGCPYDDPSPSKTSEPCSKSSTSSGQESNIWIFSGKRYLLGQGTCIPESEGVQIDSLLSTSCKVAPGASLS